MVSRLVKFRAALGKLPTWIGPKDGSSAGMLRHPQPTYCLAQLKCSSEGWAAYQLLAHYVNEFLGFSLKEGKRTILSLHLRLSQPQTV